MAAKAATQVATVPSIIVSDEFGGVKAAEMFSLDGKGLLKQTQAVLHDYHETYKKIALQAILNIHHAAKHGDVDALNLLYQGLTRDDQAKLRNFLRRVAIVCGMGLPDGKIPTGQAREEYNKAAEYGAIFKFSGSKQRFSMRNNSDAPHVKKMKDRVVELCTTQLLVPNVDKNGWQRFNYRGLIESYTEIGDKKALETLFTTVSKMVDDNQEGARRFLLSPKVRKLVAGIKDDIEKMLAANETKHAAEANETRSSARAGHTGAQPAA